MINIENGLVLHGPELEPIKSNILIEDNLILEISPHASGGEKIDAEGCIVSPSLINSHVHLGDSVAKDVGDGEPIEKLVKPPHGLKHQILTETSPQTMVKSMKSSINDMLSTGTTSFLDFREGDLHGLELLKKATDDIPINALPLGRHKSFLDPNVELSQVEKACHEIIKPSQGIGLSGFGEISDEVARTITQICHDEGKISAIHVAEYEKVQKESLERTGATEVERAIEAGFNLLIHLTSPPNSDLKLVADNDIPVVSCPRSNGALSVGIPPIKKMWDMGIKLLLGTDNLMFNSPNMFREMEYALKVTRGLSKKYFPPKEILKMATVNPGQVFKLNSGCLEEGRRADVMVTQQLSMDPVLSIINRTEPGNIKALISGGIIFSGKNNVFLEEK